MKVFDAFRLSHGDYPTLLEAVDRIRPQLNALGKDIIDRWIASKATEFIDLKAVGATTEELDTTPLQKAIGLFLEEEKRAQNHRNPPVDAGASFSLFLHEGRFYIKIYAENEQIKKLMTSELDLENFEYWNNTDRPDEISESDWEERAATWRTILGYHKPCDRGPTFEFNAPSPSFSVERTVDLQPDYPARLRRATRQLLIAQRMNAAREELEKSKSTEGYTKIIFKVDDDLHEDPLPDDAQAALLHVSGKLKETLTKEDFLP